MGRKRVPKNRVLFGNYLIIILVLICVTNILQVTPMKSEKITEVTSKKCYRKELLLSVEHSPNQLTTGVDNNVLYFSFDMCSGQGYYPAAIDLSTKNVSMLRGIKDAFAMTTDRSNGDIYFGGAHGIYKFTPSTSSLKKLTFKGLDIWWLVKRKELYFVRFPSLNAYSYSNKTVRALDVLENTFVQAFVFDKDDNLLFINSSGLFGIRNGDTDIFSISDSPVFDTLATDNNGVVYVCSDDGVFVVDEVKSVRKVFNISGVLGITFDQKNNMIYSDSHNFIRLLPS